MEEPTLFSETFQPRCQQFRPQNCPLSAASTFTFIDVDFQGQTTMTIPLAFIYLFLLRCTTRITGGKLIDQIDQLIHQFDRNLENESNNGQSCIHEPSTAVVPIDRRRKL